MNREVEQPISAQRNGMTGERWRELIARKSPGVRYMHVSCEAYMTADPRGLQFPAIAVIENRAGTRTWPIEKQRRGHTLSVGMTQQKRRLRDLRRKIRLLRRAEKHRLVFESALKVKDGAAVS